MIENSRLSIFNGLLLTIAFLYTCFFIIYAQNAWFYQDDFTFLYRHIHEIHWSNLWTFENFGRFVSRDLYWYYLYKFFGFNSILFFIFNLSLLGFNAFLIYKFFHKMGVSQSLALTNGVLYYICLPALVDFYWISNSQHLLAHTFILAFLLIVTKEQFFFNSSWKEQSLSLIVFIIALYSNILSLFVLAFVFFRLIISYKSIKLSKQLVMYIVFLVTIGLYFSFEIKKYSTGAYTTDISYNTLISNLEFYIEPYGVNVTVFFLIMIGALIWNIKRKNLANIEVFILSVAFYIPFAFASTQHYHNYTHLTTVMFLAFILNSFPEKKINVKILAISIVFLIISSTKGFMNYMSNDPLGKNIKNLCVELKMMNLQSHEIIFKSDKGNELPGFWWALGFGDALTLFVDSTKIYSLSTSEPNSIEIDQHFKIINRNVELYGGEDK